MNVRWRSIARANKQRERNRANRRSASKMPPEEPGSDSEVTGIDVVPATFVPPVQPAAQHPFAVLAGLLETEDEAAS